MAKQKQKFWKIRALVVPISIISNCPEFSIFFIGTEKKLYPQNAFSFLWNEKGSSREICNKKLF
jgi:hypothetical protein